MYQLGPELFELLNAKQRVGKQTPVVYGTDGLTNTQVATIESLLGFPLPPDFSYLLQNVRDPGGVFFSWADFKIENYDRFIDWVWQGIAFDIEQSDVWLYRWGERPASLPEALDIAKRDFTKWPRLLPIHAHRCLVADPCEPGNPVFSIMQTDIIYYGSNLAHYLVNEFVDQTWEAPAQEKKPRHIEVWSDFAEERDRILASGWGKMT
jgi:hypothetical protein